MLELLVLPVLVLVLRVLEVARHAERGVLVLDHSGARLILDIALLLVGLNSNVSIDGVKVFFLFCKHLSSELVVGLVKQTASYISYY